MGGNNRSRSNKAKNRKPRNPSYSGRGLFVEGGVLSDWADFNSPPSRGKSSRGGRGRGSGNNSRNGNTTAVSNPKNSKNASGSGSKSDSKKSRGNQIVYVYPSGDSVTGSAVARSGVKDSNSDWSHPIVLVDSKESQIVAFIDEGPNKEPQNEGCIYDCIAPFTVDAKQDKESEEVDYTCDYDAGFSLYESSHRGLGFHDDEETARGGIGLSSKEGEKEDPSFDSSSSSEDMDADVGFPGGASVEMDDALPVETSTLVENEGYLSIGGLRLYTHDLSDEESDGGDEDISSYDGTSDSSDSEESAGSSESDGSSDTDSDVDEEVAADYYEGTGGITNFVDVEKLVGQVPSSSSEDRFDETLKKFGGIDLQEASAEFGMKKPQSGRKHRGGQKSTPAKHVWASSVDDLMFVKDPRTVSGKKKHAAKFPQSWPFESQKNKNFWTPGAKKKHRKEIMALKRRERMIRRGVDLQKINSKLQQMVLDGVDNFTFLPMHSRDCSQVQRLAAIYRLRSVCQGSGKKRLVTVTWTQHTSMPSANDKIRLEKLIGAGDEDSDFVVTGVQSHKKGGQAAKKSSRGSGKLDGQSGSSKLFNNSGSSRGHKDSGKKRRDGKTGYYASPVSFVSSGVMCSETVELKTIEKTETTNSCNETKVATSSIQYGAFEMHTTGFGSKMMAKMGFLEGRGLGKDGQGIAEPIEVLQRPKALGLGAEVPETSGNSAKKEFLPRSARSARFGSEVAARSGKSPKIESLGFGGFEKHTKGFGSKMMAKMGFVEGMGLGRDSQGIVNPLVATRRPKSQGLGAKSY